MLSLNIGVTFSHRVSVLDLLAELRGPRLKRLLLLATDLEGHLLGRGVRQRRRLLRQLDHLLHEHQALLCVIGGGSL